MKKACIITYGCKLNQYETQLMMQQLKDEYTFSDSFEGCDLVIINSCAVTAKAAKESRNAARRVHRKNPLARIIYTGCDSYLEKNLPATIVGNSYKQEIKKALLLETNDTDTSTRNYPLNATLTQFHGRARAFVKIQEGCNNHCTFCIIPKLRGKSRDKPIELIMDELRALENFGEIVLTGTDIGSYGNLKQLLKKIVSENLKSRIRISSIEPMYVDDELIEIVSDRAFAHHLHIPLQSGCSRILKLMGRNYTKEEYARIVHTCYKKGIFVGTDVIVGFPSETDKDFSETYSFIEALPLTYGHVFTYSPRPHTAAIRLKFQPVRGPVARKRNVSLKELFERKFRESVKEMVGKTTTLVVEKRTLIRNNRSYYRCVSSQYFPVLTHTYRSGLIEAKIRDFDGEFAYA